MSELCETCGKADSNEVPCYLMFREGTEIQSCGAYEENVKKHAKLVAKNATPEKAKSDVKVGGK